MGLVLEPVEGRPPVPCHRLGGLAPVRGDQEPLGHRGHDLRRQALVGRIVDGEPVPVGLRLALGVDLRRAPGPLGGLRGPEEPVGGPGEGVLDLDGALGAGLEGRIEGDRQPAAVVREGERAAGVVGEADLGDVQLLGVEFERRQWLPDRREGERLLRGQPGGVHVRDVKVQAHVQQVGPARRGVVAQVAPRGGLEAPGVVPFLQKRALGQHAAVEAGARVELARGAEPRPALDASALGTRTGGHHENRQRDHRTSAVSSDHITPRGGS